MGANPSSRRGHCRSPQVGSSCHKQACQRNPLRKPLSGAGAIPVTHSRALPTGKNHSPSSCNVTVNLRIPPVQNAPPTRIKSSVTRFLSRFSLLHGVAVRCAPACEPGTHLQDRRVANDRDNPLRAEFHLLSPRLLLLGLTCFVCVCVCVCVRTLGHTQTQRAHRKATDGKLVLIVMYRSLESARRDVQAVGMKGRKA